MKCKYTKTKRFFNKVFRNTNITLNYILLAFSLFLLGCLIFIFIQTIFSGNYKPDFSAKGVEEMQKFWCNYKDIIMAFGGTFTLWIISYNLTKYLDMEVINALGYLRDKLNTESNVKVHTKIMCENNQKEFDKKIEPTATDIYNYLGTIEYGAIMLKRDSIPFNEFYNQFGYRIEHLAVNNDIRNSILNEKEYYEALIYVINLFVDEGKLEEQYRID